MNATIIGYEGQAFDYKVEFRQIRGTPCGRTFQRPSGRRRGKGPQLFNQIRQQRRKRVTW